MNRYRLPWAVQYEISRYRSQLKAYCFTIEEYDEIFDKLCKRNLASRLQNNQPDGSNTEARQIFHLVRSVVRKNRTTNDGAVKEADLDAMELKVDASQIEMKDPYLALDAEEKAIISGSGAGLGLSPGCPEGPEWYGGQG
ncbi:hypothetical protein DL93DRAFT_2073706 [Clavulina sp. PMI_390]|nr:hypothetical protein DL93DRAFT_2073706 [Clavulina sp. PMI_390]